MSTLFTFLLGAAGPLVLRVFMMLGIGTLTFTGVTEGLNALISNAQSSWAGVPGDVMGLAGLAGIPECLGIIAGAFVARAGMWVAVSATRWIVR